MSGIGRRAPSRFYGPRAQGNASTQTGFNRFFRESNIPVLKPSWQGVTVVRPLPVVVPADVHPSQAATPCGYRFASGDPDAIGEFEPWVSCYVIADNVGQSNKVSFIVSDPRDEDGPSIEETPLWILYNECMQAKRMGTDRPGWSRLLDYTPGQGTPLSRPVESWMMRAIFVMRGQDQMRGNPRGLNPGEVPPVLLLKGQAWNAIAADLDKEVPNGDQYGTDWTRRYEFGDPVSLDQGAFFTIYNLKNGDPRQAQRAQQGGASLGDMAAQMAAQGGGQQTIGYGAFVTKSHPIHNTSASLSAMAEQLKPSLLWWDNIVYVPTLEEQAHMLALRFPADLVLQAFESYPNWIPETVRQKAVNARSIAVPGLGFPGGGHFGQPQQGGFGQPQQGGFGQPQQGGFGQPPAGPDQQQAGGFGQPAGGFGQPAGGFGQPPAGSGQSPVGFGAGPAATPADPAAQPAGQPSFAPGSVPGLTPPGQQPTQTPSPIPGFSSAPPAGVPGIGGVNPPGAYDGVPGAQASWPVGTLPSVPPHLAGWGGTVGTVPPVSSQPGQGPQPGQGTVPPVSSQPGQGPQPVQAPLSPADAVLRSLT